MKYTYKTIKDKRGNSVRYRCWKEQFGDGGNAVTIPRMQAIKLNGEAIRIYSFSELKRMTAAQRKSIELPIK